jgi:hypothetical protein
LCRGRNFLSQASLAFSYFSISSQPSAKAMTAGRVMTITSVKG